MFEPITQISIGDTQKPVSEFSEKVQTIVGLLNSAGERHDALLTQIALTGKAIERLGQELQEALSEPAEPTVPTPAPAARKTRAKGKAKS